MGKTNEYDVVENYDFGYSNSTGLQTLEELEGLESIAVGTIDVPEREGVKVYEGKKAIEINNGWICAYLILPPIVDC